MLSSFLPAFLLSGFIYSIETMPRVIQAITLFVPARYFVTILKGVFLKGVGLSVLWSSSCFCCALRRASCFSWRPQAAARRWRELCGNGSASSFAKSSFRRCASRACACCCSCRPDPAHGLRLRREPGRRPRRASPGWIGPHARKPRPARRASKAPAASTGGAAAQRSAKCTRLLDRGNVQAVVRVLPGFARDIERGRATRCRCWSTAPIPTPRRWFPSYARR